MKVPKETADRLLKRGQAPIDYAPDPKCRWCEERLETLGAKRRHEIACDRREG